MMSPPSLHLIIKEDEGQYIGTDDKGIIIFFIRGYFARSCDCLSKLMIIILFWIE